MVLMAPRVAKVMTPISGVESRGNKPVVLSDSGFTLLELLIVLSIIVIASAVVLPNITGTESNILAAQVRQTASVFNYARRLAIVKGAPQVATLIQMDPENPDYEEFRGEVIQKATMPPLENLKAEVSFQADINEEPEVLDSISVIFFPQGGSTGGILNFTIDDLAASIRVDPLTGRIAIRYPGEEFDEDDL